ncbi:MAG TPA: GH3 auxin-responsive promoter family protein, partial [Bacteroidia bacterium]|nr:GH3 auxin-responsive promoter family protein [Bacteroidia bacterium]
MAVINSIFSWLMKKRMHQIDLFIRYPYEVQQEWLYRLVDSAKDTEWGKKYDYASIKTEAEFKKRIPVSEYDDLKPYIDRLRKGEENILWPGEIRWFAKSSGTTGDKSKFIPVSQESLDECHFKGGKDMLTLYCYNYPDTHLFDGKTLSLGGSHKGEEGNILIRNGDLSAILMENLPGWAEFFRAPELSIALMSEWEEKMNKIALAIMNENI